MGYDYDRIAVEIHHGVAFATLDNPPLNLMTLPLYEQLVAFTAEVEQDSRVRALVLQSADPEFFIAHFDVEVLLAMDTTRPAKRSNELNPFHQMCERLRTMPKATIAKIAGRVGGGGSELAASCDMRFGALGKTVVNQMEVAVGILPGGTGTQRLPRLIGRGRALEVILACDDLDAATAERWGYLNRALPPEELDAFVDRLAFRIASFPADALRRAKAAVNNAELALEEALLEEAYLFQQTLRTRDAQRLMQRFLEVGGQTREGELRMGSLCAELNEQA